MNHHITIIGAGNMGSILVTHAVTFFPHASITVCDRNADKLSSISQRYPHVRITPDIASAITGATLVFLAMKPQQFDDCGSILKEHLAAHACVLSVMAGVSTSHIAEQTGIDCIIRMMPNTPMKLNKGVIGWFATKTVSQEVRDQVCAFLGQAGTPVACNSEDDINKITAISGSGPAYFFYAVISLAEAAQALGFGQEQSMELAVQTLLGAAALLEEEPDAFMLQKQVTSKGGTTEAALKVFDEEQTRDIWKRAVERAYNRAKELGNENN